MANRKRNTREGFIEYSVGDGKVKASIVNGRLIYIINDLEIGLNEQSTIGLSHIYNSDLEGTYYGRGFKLDIDQQIDYNYRYINALGDLCPLEQIGTNIYQETTGYNMILTEEQDSYGDITNLYFTDDIGNTLYFNQDKYLIKSVNVINSTFNITKIYERDSLNRIITIYDIKAPSTKITLSYKTNGYLESIKTINDFKAVETNTYYYENDKLIYIKKERNNYLLDIIKFGYNEDSQLYQIVSIKYKEMLQISYSSNKVKKIKKGEYNLTNNYFTIIDNSYITLNPLTRNGVDFKIGEEIEDIRFEVSTFKSNLKIEFTRGLNEVIVKEENGQSIKYYYNNQEEIVSSFLLSGNKMYGNLNDNAIMISEEGKGEYLIDNCDQIYVESSSSKYLTSENNKPYNNLKDIEGNIITYDKINKYLTDNILYEIYKIGFYFKYNGSQSNVEVKIRIITNYATTHHKKTIKNITPNIWQYIEIPVYLKNETINTIKPKALSISSMFIAIENPTENSEPYYISALKMSLDQESNYYGAGHNDILTEGLKICYKMHLNDIDRYINLKTDDNYITNNDITLMLINQAKSPTPTNFDLIYNDGKKRIKNVYIAHIYFTEEGGPTNCPISDLVELRTFVGSRKTKTVQKISNFDPNLFQIWTTTIKVNLTSPESIIDEKVKIYDHFGNIIVEDLNDNYGKIYVYDTEGKLIEEFLAKQGDLEQNILKMDKTKVSTYYKYNSHQNLIEVSQQMVTRTLTGEQKGSKIKLIDYVYKNFDGRSQILTKTVNNQYHLYSYDQINRLIKIESNGTEDYNYNEFYYTNYDEIKSIKDLENEYIFENSKDQTIIKKVIDGEPKKIYESLKKIEGQDTKLTTINYLSDNTSTTSITKYDYMGRVYKTIYPNNEITYEYDTLNYNQIKMIGDSETNYKYKFSTLNGQINGYSRLENEDLDLKVTKINELNSEYQINTKKYEIKKELSEKNQLIQMSINNQIYGYTYNDLEQIETSSNGLKINNNIVDNLETSYIYDSFHRIKKTITNTSPTNIISEVEYDNFNRITRLNNQIYTYDNNNQIETEVNQNLDTGYLYVYNKGNLVEVKNSNNNTLIKQINYDDFNRVTSCQKNGVEIRNYQYGDNYLNPVSINNNTIEYTFNNLIEKYGKYTFTYDYNGVRLTKIDTSTNPNTTTKYYYDGNTILGESRVNKELRYFYDQSGICGFSVNDTYYKYIKDILGNVTYILTSSNQIVGEYRYDAWGNHDIIVDINQIASLNPIRYRCYYFDTDLKMFYCLSRYYDPEIGRFITADSLDYLDPKSINGLNLYAYAKNNPVMFLDSDGHFPILIALAISIGVSLAFTAGKDLFDDGQMFNGSVSWNEYAGAFASGLISGFSGGLISTVLLGGLSSLVYAGITQTLNDDNFMSVMLSGMAIAGLSYGAGQLIRKIASTAKAGALVNMKGNVGNNEINKILRPIANDLNIGANKATVSYISSQIFKANQWTGGKLAYELSSNISSEIFGLFK